MAGGGINDGNSAKILLVAAICLLSAAPQGRAQTRSPPLPAQTDALILDGPASASKPLDTARPWREVPTPAPKATATITPSPVPPPPQPLRLNIATWNLTGGIPKQIAQGFAPKRKPVWRNTFGPRPPSASNSGGVTKLPEFTADVIAVQSVADLRLLRRIFPARKYHVIVSRQLLSRRLLAKAAMAPAAGRGTTAIVIARQSKLRVTAQEQLLGFAGKPSQRDNAQPPMAAALAVRLVKNGHAIWLLSLDLSPPCAADASPSDHCAAVHQQAGQLKAWLRAKRAKGEQAILAGSFNRPLGGAILQQAAALWKELDERPEAKTAQPASTPPPAQGGTSLAEAPDAAKPGPRSTQSAIADLLRRSSSAAQSALTGAAVVEPRAPAAAAPDEAPASWTARVSAAAGPLAVAQTPATSQPRGKRSKTAAVAGQSLMRFPAQHVPAGCRSGSLTKQPARDYILVDLVNRDKALPAPMGWPLIDRSTEETGNVTVTARGGARPHCPIALDVQF